MTKQRFFLTQLLLCVCLLLSAVDLATYYSAAKGKKGSALKTALAGIIYKSSAATTYAGLKTAYTKTDVRSDGYLNDMYSNITKYTPGSAFGSTITSEGSGYNREHTIPQSVFSEASPMVSDLFHVYPIDGYINNIRANYCHGNVGTVTKKSSGSYSKLGSPTSTLTNNGCTESVVFEPADEWKGDIARTYFYFVTCYQTKMSSFKSFGAFNHDTYPSLTTWAQKCYMAWSKSDQVSTWETTRNENVYNYPQTASNNRNPFIDFPGLEEYIWGSYTNVAFDPGNYTNPYTGTGGSSGGETTPITPTLTFAKTNVSLEVGNTVDNPATTNSTGTVTYKSSNTEVAAVSSTGVITGVAAGSAVITASVAAHGDYAAKTTSCNVTVTKSSTGGDDPTTGTSGTGTYTVASTSSVKTTGTVPSGSSATYSQTFSTISQITSGNTAILTLSGYDGYKITGITLNMHSNTSKGAGTLSVVAGSTTLASISSATNFNSWYDNTSYTTTFKDVTVSMTNTSYTVGADEKVVITITGTTNSLYISSYTITYESAATAKVGDVNLDGSVDVSDVTALVDIILGKWSGNHGEADFDGDGNYTVSDVTKLVDLILKK